ncbi:DUF4234 domain-containing protein [Actinomadura madurae]|uniref:DUF4234 domain-containing protein n=1 Tax=Actinomadura madurae TaxID=1993 RepID=UPI0020262174|nr:DUF4234 domain-containing protein [Actinomadura madurae]MCP9948916.1 DUF4234 domain-containing protein [Actinomadura madurae]MCP9965688.1 DUF4234 domain-containing protein [Actinomadura madurae]MCP9978156.1 DUF4234 domain-containing protein [Actinomadura madurae]MCQ0014368.1 DUF4234 domain-containing protein [Actinomadura madurae]URM94521.1 DUF4234 domain-containing protein [Actinomadura madurae]
MSYPQQGQGQQHPQQQQQAYQGGYAPAPAQQQAPTARGAGQNMKRRNPIGAWLGLPIITFGIYGLVWFFKVHNELHEYDRRIDNAAVNALLSLLFGSITFGIWPLIMWVKLAGRIAQAQRAAGLQPSCSGGMGFLLGILGFGVLYYQLQLNKVTDRYGDTPAGQQVSLVA